MNNQLNLTNNLNTHLASSLNSQLIFSYGVMVSTGGSNPLSLRSSRSGATNNGKFAVAVGSIRTSER